MTLKELIQTSVEKFSNKTFIIDKGEYSKNIYTYKQIYEKALKIISYFKKQNISKGDKVITFAPNSSDYVAIMWACALSGVILVPLDVNSQTAFLEKIYSTVKAKLVFCSVYKSSSKTKNYFIEEIENIYEQYTAKESTEKITPQDIFEIVYTSGTTSDPKGVILTQENLYENVISAANAITHNTKNASMLSILPLSHLFEQNCGLFIPTLLGAKITYISSKKTSKILEAIKEEKIDTIVSVPLFMDMLKQKIIAEAQKQNRNLEQLLKKYQNSIFKKLIFNKIRKKLSPLQTFIVGGSAISPETEKFWTNLGFWVLPGYGLTETSPVLTWNSTKEYKSGSAGKPLKNIEIKLVENEIIAKGKNVFGGYYNNPEETKKFIENDWIKTGDLGKIDEDGFLFITGRKKNVIISPSGMNIYPEDIEKTINTFNSIKDSVVLGLNEGKDLTAIILTKTKINPEEFKKQINEKLSENQKLTKIILWSEEDFPRTTTKKIIRREVESFIKNKGSKQIVSHSDDKLKNLIAIICKTNESSLKEDTKLVNIGLDSIKRIELVTKIEEQFNIDFEETNINEKTTLSNLRNSIKTSSIEKSHSQITFLNSRLFNPIRFLLQEISFLGLSAFYRIKLSGKENLPKEKCILIANHVSMLDTFAIYKSLPFKYQLNTCPAAAKDFFFKNKTVGLLGKLTFNIFGFSRKEDTKQSLKDFGKLTDTNHNILIYPEGTRSRNGKLAEFKEGIGVIAREINIPIVPIKIKGLHEVLPTGNYWPKPGKIEIKIGKPLKFNKMQSPQEISKILHKIIEEM
jgi:long-chain acyl-CoA synthetase